MCTCEISDLQLHWSVIITDDSRPGSLLKTPPEICNGTLFLNTENILQEAQEVSRALTVCASQKAKHGLIPKSMSKIHFFHLSDHLS